MLSIDRTEHGARLYSNVDHRRPRARTPTVMSSGSTGSGIDPIYRTEKIHLADVDSIVAEDGVRYRRVEVGVRNCHLQEVVLPAEELAGRPRKTNFAIACARILRLSHTL